MKKVIIILLGIFIIKNGFASEKNKLLEEEAIRLKVEIAGMAAKDQAIRYAIIELQKKFGDSYPIQHTNLMKYWQEIDSRNSKKIADMLSKWGWLGSEQVGYKCNLDLWLLVQHSDKNLALQEEVLENLKKSGLKNKQDLKHYAYLYDRVQTNKNLPQRYGTQGYCKKAHDWQPFKIESIKNLNKFRRSAGMVEFEAYQKIASKFCY
jgi:hypothetical protein